MGKILTVKQAINIGKKIRDEGKSTVLVGGCFDILHIGHLKFLQKAKEHGDILLVLLESDEKINHLKGKDRPINTQEDRAEVLAALKIVDYVIPLTQFETNSQYDDLITRLKPDTIATTKGDPQRIHKERQAKLIDIKVIDVIAKISNQSTTKLVKLLNDYWI